MTRRSPPRLHYRLPDGSLVDVAYDLTYGGAVLSWTDADGRPSRGRLASSLAEVEAARLAHEGPRHRPVLAPLPSRAESVPAAAVVARWDACGGLHSRGAR